MKKIINIAFIFLLLIPMFVVPEEAQAKTLGDLKVELDRVQKKYDQTQNEQAQTKEQIAANNKKIDGIKTSIAQAQIEIEQLNTDIEKLNQEIEQLKKTIVVKNDEIKKIISFTQISAGDNSYLEYAFGAQDFTDFIYRVSISEQLTAYNEQLIDGFNAMIDSSKQKQAEIKEKQDKLAKTKADLASNQVELEIATATLGRRLVELSDIKLSVQDEIDLQRDAIKVLENMGCSDNEDIQTCGNDTLPSDTAFLRPIVEGYVTSEYGYRKNPISGRDELHEAIDMSQTGYIPIYAAANGTVIGTRYRSYCGGNMIFVLHTINGQKYTTEYAHLREINVSIGQTVTRNTQIAVMGGNESTEWWDTCSVVQHLHFGIARGHYLRDYYSWDTFVASTFNPREIVNFPWSGGSTDYFANRTTKY